MKAIIHPCTKNKKRVAKQVLQDFSKRKRKIKRKYPVWEFRKKKKVVCNILILYFLMPSNPNLRSIKPSLSCNLHFPLKGILREKETSVNSSNSQPIERKVEDATKRRKIK